MNFNIVAIFYPFSNSIPDWMIIIFLNLICPLCVYCKQIVDKKKTSGRIPRSHVAQIGRIYNAVGKRKQWKVCRFSPHWKEKLEKNTVGSTRENHGNNNINKLSSSPFRSVSDSDLNRNNWWLEQFKIFSNIWFVNFDFKIWNLFKLPNKFHSILC